MLHDMSAPTTIGSLVALAVALGAADSGDLTPAEARLVRSMRAPASRPGPGGERRGGPALRPGPSSSASRPGPGGRPAPAPAVVDEIRARIRDGEDPLGEAYCAIRSPQERRRLGQTYTPPEIIGSMVGWAAGQGRPARVVDPGAGSGRYLLAAGRQFPQASLHGVDIDPLATLMLRANLAAAGLAHRARIHLADYRALSLPEAPGPTLFLGNPPYVRHHRIAPEWKAWLTETARRRGLPATALAGLHAHFLLATAELGHDGDYGAFITSAEWLDTGYGRLMRRLLLDDLGAASIHVLDPAAAPFADAATTGAITCFRMGRRPPSITIRRVASVHELGRLDQDRDIPRHRLAEAARWSALTRAAPGIPTGYVELGELCRVHRGAVTGANAVWVRRDRRLALPARVLFPSITRARELFDAGARLESADALRRVVDLPVDLDVLDDDERRQIDAFLREARALGVPEGYIASRRRAWWSVGLREPAPILATYMARRPPAFVRNDAGARHINIAHGLYPREPMAGPLLDRLADHLRAGVALSRGRTYAGGLMKFEPGEMERIPVPGPDLLAEGPPPGES